MNHLLVISGGVGKRFGAPTPKQYHKNKHGKMIFEQSLDGFDPRSFESVVVVSSEEYKETCISALKENGFKNVFWAVSGKERTDSIRNGVNKLCSEVNCVEEDKLFIQEAVRPFVSKQIVNSLIEFDQSCPIVSPAIHPVVLFANISDSENQTLIKKNDIVELQLPKRMDLLLCQKLLNETKKDSASILDETELFLDKGYKISFVPGDQANIKITYFDDLLTLNKLSE